MFREKRGIYMEIKVYNNVFEKEFKTFQYDPTKSLIEQIDSNVEKNIYKETLVECYDSETGETFYAPIEENTESSCVMIVVNGKNVDKDYLPKENDVVNVYFLPMNSQTGWTIAGFALGAVLAVGAIFSFGAVAGIAVPLGAYVVGGLIGAGVGAVLGSLLWEKTHQDSSASNTIDADKQSIQSPDVRGSENGSIKNNNFPFVIGKHLVTPFVVGDPVTTYSGTRGVDAYIRELLVVGYAPLKLTDFKLGEFMLAYNKSHPINGGTVTKDTLLSGLLKGYSQAGAQPDSGDIVDYWKNNDVSIEILQQKNGVAVNYGTIYTEVEDDQQINANVLFIADKALDDTAKVTYKGAEFPNNFRTNGTWFTTPCPKEFTITLDFPSGLYRSWQETTTYKSGNDTKSRTSTKYGKMSLWVCAQWRIYNESNPSPKSDGSDYYSWNNIDFGYTDTFTEYNATLDKNYHHGNNLGDGLSVYGDFINKQLQNFENLGGEDGVSEIRLSATISLTPEQCSQVIADSNPAKIIEVRVLRVSPNYINEESKTNVQHETGTTTGPWSFSDFFKVSSIITKVFDEEKLIKTGNIVPVRPLSEKDMRKYCVIAIKAKADASGYLSQQIRKLSCTAESFSPYWDFENNKVMPENVHGIKKYYGYYQDGERVNRSNDAQEIEVSKSAYEEARRDGFNWYEEDCGSNYDQIMNQIVFSSSYTHNERTAYKLTEEAAKYNNNSVSSGFLLACVGKQAGPIAVGYESIDLLAINDWALKTRALKDGSTFKKATIYNGVQYNAGDEVPVRMEANGYVYQGQKQEDLLSKLALCGRAIWCADENGRIRVVMDAPVDYTSGVVNSQNCISSQNTFSYEDVPAGLFMSFSDENDGYEANQFYCWNDGNSIERYHGTVEPYQIEFVTNPYQMWLLGRYILALRCQMKEMLTRKIGPEGVLYKIGDVVLVQGDDLLIGDCSGRIKEILQENNVIKGVILDSSYEYTATQGDDNNSNQGITLFQAGYFGKNNAITLPIAMPMTVSVDGKNYTLKKGITNLVIFGEVDGLYGVVRGSDDPSATKTINRYNFKIGDIAMLGIRDKISAPYRITKIKPEKDGCFTETLLPYDESFYNSGAEMPTFQNYMTPPQPVEPAITLSETPSSIVDWNKAQSTLYNMINSVTNGDATVGAPDAVSVINAKAEENGLRINWSPLDQSGLHNVLKSYTVAISKDSGNTWFFSTSLTDTSYIYYFNRRTDLYPEAADFSTWRVKVLCENVYGLTSEETILNSIDINGYGTWIPPVPVIATTDADETGINITYNCSLSNVYGTNLFEVYVYYSGTLQRTLTISENQVKYLFDRGTDGYPEKPNTQGITLDTRTLDNYTVKVKAINVTSTNYSESQTANCTYANYKTWIPNTPSISSRVVNRSVTLYLTSDNSCYGQTDYLIGVRSYKDTDGTFYVPDLETNPYSRESAYKLISEGTYVVGKLESDSVYSQTMPLETQNGTTGCLDVNESEEDNRILEIPLGSSDDRALQLGLGGFAPIDTQYQFEVYAFNRTVEKYYDSLPNATSHNYDISTYHKVSLGYARKYVTALATSVQDVLNGSIISDKIKEGAITETKIEDDAITAPKIQANAVVADKMYTYNMLCLHEGAHAISGYAYNAETDEDMKDLIWRIKNSKESSIKESLISQLDTFIKTHSNNFWIGLDTAHPEFYMGSDRISNKGSDNISYFHYYYDDITRSTNLDIKLTNFIVTAVSSTVKGFFNVRSKLAQYAGINAFLQVNPEFTGSVGDYTAGYYFEGDFYDDERHTSYITPETGVVYKDIPTSKYYQWNGTAYYEINATASESIFIKGDVRIGNKNSSGNAGTLEVNGDTTLKSGLLVGTSDSSLTQNTKLYGTVGIKGATQILGDTTIGINQSGQKNNLTVNGNITNNGNTTVNGTLGATALSQGILDMIYPVGSLYWTSKAPNAGGNPNTLFGGNWEQIKDTFVWAIGDTPANQLPAGEITHTLVKSEMPSHDHSGVTGNPTTNPSVNVSGSFSTDQKASFYIRRNDDDNSIVKGDYHTSVTAKAGDSWLTLDTDTQDSKSLDLVNIDVSLNNQSVSSSGTLPDHKHSISSEGGDGAHNNMPPYVMKYCWERKPDLI